jgi:hypothetical protein
LLGFVPGALGIGALLAAGFEPEDCYLRISPKRTGCQTRRESLSPRCLGGGCEHSGLGRLYPPGDVLRPTILRSAFSDRAAGNSDHFSPANRRAIRRVARSP